MALPKSDAALAYCAPAMCAWKKNHSARACVPAQAGKSVEMENFFSRLTLDIIGKAVFNYDFDSLTHDDPVIQVGPTCVLLNAGSPTARLVRLAQHAVNQALCGNSVVCHLAGGVSGG